jgi:hypothetical protein
MGVALVEPGRADPTAPRRYDGHVVREHAPGVHADIEDAIRRLESSEAGSGDHAYNRGKAGATDRAGPGGR